MKSLQQRIVPLDESSRSRLKTHIARESTFSCEAVVSYRADNDQGKIEAPTALAADFLVTVKQLRLSPEKQKRLVLDYVGLIAKLINRSNIIVDHHMADQLLIYMALASGTSTMHTGSLTEKSNHTLTQISIIDQMLPESKIVVTDITKDMDFAGRTEY